MKKITLTDAQIEAIRYAADFFMSLGGHSNNVLMEHAVTFKELANKISPHSSTKKPELPIITKDSIFTTDRGFVCDIIKDGMLTATQLSSIESKLESAFNVRIEWANTDDLGCLGISIMSRFNNIDLGKVAEIINEVLHQSDKRD